MDLTAHWVGIAAIVIFVVSYAFVITEEFSHLRKSVPVIFGAGVIWAIIAYQYMGGMDHSAEEAVRHFLIEFGELFLFLLSAMTYVNSMSERGIFDALRSWLVSRGFSYRQLFWITGIISFFLSPIIDNLTTALVMCAVVLAVGQKNKRFISLACVNIVVAANAGGAFSPFGDITTLMVWQRGIVNFWTFFNLFIPSVVNYVIPAVVMSLAVEKGQPDVEDNKVVMKRGAKRIMFFFGVIMCVGGLGFIGYLDLVSAYMYGELGPTFANIMVGILSAIVDNIPVMVAVLQMNPTMDLTQWLLVTLTAGVGGSMLSIGSAAGVALMGQARGIYTFFGHMKWTPVIALGYAASIWVHLLIN